MASLPLVPLFPHLRPAANPGKGPLPGPGHHRREGRQVPARENLSQIESTLKTAGNNQVTVKELPGLNHLFQKCKTGTPSEYAGIEQTIDPGALAVIADWISERAGSVVK